MPSVSASAEELRRRKIVGINSETVTDVTSTDFPGHYPGEDHAWSFQTFRKNFDVRIHKNHPYEASFSLIGIDASIANAFRRILLAEIPTLAIETVFVANNTSIVQDEVLAARLGLIPLTGALQGLNWLIYEKRKAEAIGDDTSNREPKEEKEPSDRDTICLKLNVKCEWKEGRRKEATEPNELYERSNVYAKDLIWVPQGRQSKYFPGPDGAIKPVNPDILLAKLRPGQTIDLDLHAVMGIGADHAKYSPVATATYRLLPTIDIVKPIVGDRAKKFARCFPKGVIALQAVTDDEAAQEGSGYEGLVGEKKAVVKDTMKDTVSRECLRHEEFQDKVKLGRVRDHFIFAVESTGQYDSDWLFLESVKVLRSKCRRLKRDLQVNVMR